MMKLKLSLESEEALMRQLLRTFTKRHEKDRAYYKEQMKTNPKPWYKEELKIMKKTSKALKELNSYFGNE